MEAGRAMLRDFEKRFLNSQMFREEGGFLGFLRNKSEAYLNRGELKLKSRTMKDEEWSQLHQELTQWLLEQNDENIEGAAQFMGFFFAETLYEIPLTLLASRLVPELEGIDFETPVMIGKTLTTWGKQFSCRKCLILVVAFYVGPVTSDIKCRVSV